MRFYLRYLNPSVCTIILLLCTWAAATSDHEEGTLVAILQGGFGAYFFAKGLFCSATLWIAGRTLLERLSRTTATDLGASRKRVLFATGLIVATFLSIQTMVIHEARRQKEAKDHSGADLVSVDNPPEIALSQIATIKASEHLLVTGRLKNQSSFAWKSVSIDADVLIGGVYAGRLHATDTAIEAGEERPFSLLSGQLLSKEIKDSLRYAITTSGTHVATVQSSAKPPKP